jgi:glucose-1-phosphate thymidylyltransferase
MTQAIPKSLQPVYDKPMIYYSLSTLLFAGITDVLIISSKRHLHMFEELLKDGKQFGIHIQYAEQAQPKGIAQALTIGEDFIGNKQFALMLGDNFFYADNLMQLIQAAQDDLFCHDCSIFGYPVSNPSAYGVIDNVNNKVIEKPEHPPTNLAVPGLYFFRKIAVDIAKELKPSKRGELEITDVINQLPHPIYHELSRGVAWFDLGTPRDLHEASNFVAAIEDRTGLKIGCLEEIAYRLGLIADVELQGLILAMPRGDYKDYLIRTLQDGNQEKTTVNGRRKGMPNTSFGATS